MATTDLIETSSDSVSISSSSSSDRSRAEIPYPQKHHSAHSERRSQTKELAGHVYGSFNRTKPLVDPKADLGLNPVLLRVMIRTKKRRLGGKNWNLTVSVTIDFSKRERRKGETKQWDE
jgi:hypothetical protein